MTKNPGQKVNDNDRYGILEDQCLKRMASYSFFIFLSIFSSLLANASYVLRFVLRHVEL